MTQSRPGVAHVGRRYSLAVFIGRFSPFHNGHLAVVKRALEVADRVLIAIGSAKTARSPYNIAFSDAERQQMIRLSLSADENMRVSFVDTEDQGNMAKWTAIIRAAANEIEPDNKRITLIGHSKDKSSYYLKAFKGWGAIEVDNVGGISATHLRNYYFTDGFLIRDLDGHPFDNIPDPVREFLANFSLTPSYSYLVDFRSKVEADKKKFGPGPFLTGDAIVIQGDHVLMIRRGNHPYKGMLAFPGGFVDLDERVRDAIFRELGEEVPGLKVPEIILRKSVIEYKDFDDPRRDPRGRVVTWAALIHLNPQPPESMTDPKEIARYLALPRVAPGDDAAEAFWMPIADIKREECAFDVPMMLQWALDTLPRD